jgi:hypothetical protein
VPVSAEMTDQLCEACGETFTAGTFLDGRAICSRCIEATPGVGRRIDVRIPSVMSLLLRSRAGDSDLAIGTGFVVERAGATWLITARHVVRGRHNATDRPLSALGAVPDSLVIHHNSAVKLGQWVPVVEDIFDNDGRARWLEHPVHRGQVDTVALPIAAPDGVKLWPYVLDDLGHYAETAIGPSDHVSIIGFPFGRLYNASLATWVGGTIASEPNLPVGDFPAILVDSRTRPGSSGSPVVMYRPSGSLLPVKAGGMAIHHGEYKYLLGAYSGRIHDEADIGYVWTTAAIVDIITGGIVANDQRPAR